MEAHIGAQSLNPAALSSVPKYSGERAGEAHEWLNHIDDTGELFGWTAAQKMSIAKVRLTGLAHQWCRGSNVATWNEFKQAFLYRFGENYEVLLGRLHHMRQYHHEAAKDYCDRFLCLIAQLGHSIDHGIDAGISTMYKTYFLQGLDPQLRAQVMTQRPATLSAAMDAAQYFEDTMRDDDTKPASNHDELRNGNGIDYSHNLRSQRLGTGQPSHASAPPQHHSSMSGHHVQGVRPAQYMRYRRSQPVINSTQADDDRDQLWQLRHELQELTLMVEARYGHSMHPAPDDAASQAGHAYTQLQQMRDELQQLTAQAEARCGQHAAPTVRCYTCGQHGHSWRDCQHQQDLPFDHQANLMELIDNEVVRGTPTTHRARLACQYDNGHMADCYSCHVDDWDNELDIIHDDQYSIWSDCQGLDSPRCDTDDMQSTYHADSQPYGSWNSQWYGHSWSAPAPNAEPIAECAAHLEPTSVGNQLPSDEQTVLVEAGSAKCGRAAFSAQRPASPSSEALAQVPQALDMLPLIQLKLNQMLTAKPDTVIGWPAQAHPKVARDWRDMQDSDFSSSCNKEADTECSDHSSQPSQNTGAAMTDELRAPAALSAAADGSAALMHSDDSRDRVQLTQPAPISTAWLTCDPAYHDYSSDDDSQVQDAALEPEEAVLCYDVRNTTTRHLQHMQGANQSALHTKNTWLYHISCVKASMPPMKDSTLIPVVPVFNCGYSGVHVTGFLSNTSAQHGCTSGHSSPPKTLPFAAALQPSRGLMLALQNDSISNHLYLAEESICPPEAALLHPLEGTEGEGKAASRAKKTASRRSPSERCYRWTRREGIGVT